MKNIKKISSIMLSTVLAFSVLGSTSAFASENSTIVEEKPVCKTAKDNGKGIFFKDAKFDGKTFGFGHKGKGYSIANNEKNISISVSETGVGNGKTNSTTTYDTTSNGSSTREESTTNKNGISNGANNNAIEDVTTGGSGTNNGSSTTNSNLQNCKNILLQLNKKKVLLEGFNTELPELLVSPYTENGNTLVPLRFVAETLNAEVKWNNDTREITIIDGETKIVLTLNKKEAVVNGKKVIMTTSPKTKNNTTMVPLRFVSENLNANVAWYPESNAIEIAKEVKTIN